MVNASECTFNIITTVDRSKQLHKEWIKITKMRFSTGKDSNPTLWMKLPQEKILTLHCEPICYYGKQCFGDLKVGLF